MERNSLNLEKVDVADPIGTEKVAPNYSDDTP